MYNFVQVQTFDLFNGERIHQEIQKFNKFYFLSKFFISYFLLFFLWKITITHLHMKNIILQLKLRPGEVLDPKVRPRHKLALFLFLVFHFQLFSWFSLIFILPEVKNIFVKATKPFRCAFAKGKHAFLTHNTKLFFKN